ncbi:MAG: hypothetical protein ACREVJ_12630, partial [Gammaproteobacteria bacterium]
DANYPGTTFNTTQRGDAIVVAEKAMLYDGAGTGLLEKGFTVTRMVEPQVQSNANISIEQQRVGIRAAVYLTDTLSGSGQTYDGKLRRIELPNVSTGGLKPFDTSAGIPNAYYNDALHPNSAGAVLYATGGDTPANGWGAVV